jgi:acyl dehydratase
MNFANPAELADAVGTTLGTSTWHTLDQQAIDCFADVTSDHQWIHTDRERAAVGPYGVPVAHGFLTLSLLPVLLSEIFQVNGVELMVNRGLDHVRFKAPVRAGGRIRAVASLLSARQRPRGFWEIVLTIVVEQAADDPACVAELVLLLATGDVSRI